MSADAVPSLAGQQKLTRAPPSLPDVKEREAGNRGRDPNAAKPSAASAASARRGWGGSGAGRRAQVGLGGTATTCGPDLEPRAAGGRGRVAKGEAFELGLSSLVPGTLPMRFSHPEKARSFCRMLRGVGGRRNAWPG